MYDDSKRQLVGYDFEGGGYVHVLVGGVKTEEALDMLERLIAIKREELARQGGMRTCEPMGGVTGRA